MRDVRTGSVFGQDAAPQVQHNPGRWTGISDGSAISGGSMLDAPTRSERTVPTRAVQVWQEGPSVPGALGRLHTFVKELTGRITCVIAQGAVGVIAEHLGSPCKFNCCCSVAAAGIGIGYSAQR